MLIQSNLSKNKTIPYILSFSFLLTIIIVLSSCSNKNEIQIKNIIKLLKHNDIKLKTPQPGEWLYIHNEKGQTFNKYLSASPVTPSNSKNVIYIQPIGTFTDYQIKLIDYTADYLHIFFGLKIKKLDIIDDKIIPHEAKRIGIEGNTQLLTTFILDNILKRRIPTDAIVLMAITEKDLYPQDSWNFVFGQASYRERVGVTSMFRFSDSLIDSTSYRICLNRLIKTSSHEICHMFTMEHCTNAICTMNGSNSLKENDRRPNRLCSECTGKLLWNLKLDVTKRLKQLLSFFEKHQLINDLNLTTDDFQLIEKSDSNKIIFTPQ